MLNTDIIITSCVQAALIFILFSVIFLAKTEREYRSNVTKKLQALLDESMPMPRMDPILDDEATNRIRQVLKQNGVAGLQISRGVLFFPHYSFQIDAVSEATNQVQTKIGIRLRRYRGGDGNTMLWKLENIEIKT